MQIDNSTVIFLGLGIVFMGLVCLIIIITVLGAIMKRANRKKAAAVPAAAAAAAAPVQAEIPNKPEFVAAVSVAVAEEEPFAGAPLGIHHLLCVDVGGGQERKHQKQ